MSTRVSEFHDWIVSTLACGRGDSCVSSPITTQMPSVTPIFPPWLTMTPTITSWPTVSLLGANVAPVYLSGPTVTITANVTTDTNPTETKLRYSDLCNGEMFDIVSGLKDNLYPEATYSYSITLSSGIYEIETRDYSGDGKCQDW